MNGPKNSDVATAPVLGARIRLGLMGACIAAYSAVCGIGGGLFMTPILHYVKKMPLKNAVATSLALVSASATSATIAELLHADNQLTPERLLLVAALVIGSLLGAQAGFVVAKRIDVTFLKLVFAVILVISGMRLLFPGELPAAGPLELGVSQMEVAFASVVGFAAGFLAPLLGIGGGLVAVPALFLGVPSLGYLGARACGMAMGACASSRSLWLYAREGVVDKKRATALACGALIGASIGVQFVHFEGAVLIAKKLMGITLWVVSVRFVMDVVQSRKKS
ncbi:MAG: sulfite exporter TauE/SafE family protein [Planctomycetota bacterium]|nr:sulfite exporter TauE/SafE family protein [Planctomycetota bacterium]